ncbi:MAG TPA: 4-alpha-glucanotransferase [Chitinophagaceae bacterium]
MPSKKNPAEKKVEKLPAKGKSINGTTGQNGKAKLPPVAGEALLPVTRKKPGSGTAAKKSAKAEKPAPAKTKKQTGKPKKNEDRSDTRSVDFRLRFHTEFGQQLFITGNHPALGDGDVSRAIPLEYLDQQNWFVVIGFPSDFEGEVSYSYLLKQKDGRVDHDWGTKTFNSADFKSRSVLVIDSWNHAGYFENAFYTEPFRDVLLERKEYKGRKTPRNFTHRFSVKAPLLNHGEVVCILGHGKQLGNWDSDAPLLMNKNAEGDNWTIALYLSGLSFPEYKYGIYDTIKKQFIRYENGGNRFAAAASAGQQVQVNDGFVVLPATTWKAAGVAIPVFSLRTERSFGVGEFTDIKSLVDWAKLAGLKMVQILPVNDTSATHTWRDSYPYAAISAFALHPIFLDIEKLTDEKNRKLLESYDEKRERLNASPTVDYCKVIEEKWNYIRQIYPLQKAGTFKQAGFKDFFRHNEHWLVPYAAFCYLRDEFGTSDFNQWPEHRQYDPAAIAALDEAAHDKLNIHFFVQYHLHLQLKEATSYAHANGIIVKGDIPIGVYRFGADAWQQPELYHMDVQAGAPPDDFAVKGQNWGFPTYNWERMKKDGFRWWKLRFEQMSYYFDAFRIDHILGFFRIWSIPINAVEGIMGRFVPATPVHISEFSQRGISFDYLRYCRPFINDAVLNDIFGSRSAEVKETFLDYDGFDQYVLKDEFETQRKIQKYFEGREDRSLMEGLFDLVSNVILFTADDSGSNFHFRFGIEDTLSYKHLDPHTRHQLKQLYLNYFFERQDHYWEIEAMQKLPELKRATNMLVCGEDLGLVPHCVPDVMKQLGILSLEIQRMPKAVNREFFNPAEAPYLSVVTPSTHDMSTIRGWWEEDRPITQKFYNNELRQSGDAPVYCEPWINKAIVLQHLHAPAMWSIFQLQDLLGMNDSLRRQNPAEERINLPSDPQHYWNYRMHITIGELIASTEFNSELRGYLAAAGRTE